MSGFDLNEQVSKAKQEDEGVEVHVHSVDETPLYFTDTDGEDKPVTITVAGVHSQRYRRAEELFRKRKLKPKHLTGERIYEENIEKAAACTITWSGFVQGETDLEPTQQNIKELYRLCPWVYDQVLEAMNDHSLFFENGSTTPQSSSDTKGS